MIVVDASAVISALLNDGPARQLMGEQRLHVPYLIDTEVVSALRRQVLAGPVGALRRNQSYCMIDRWRGEGGARPSTT